MSDEDLELKTEIGRIEGTSYSIQLCFNTQKKWLIKLFKGKKLMGTNFFDVSKELTPNQNEMVNWIIKAVPIIDMNPRKVMNSLRILMKEALKKKEKIDIAKEIKAGKAKLDKSEEMKKLNIKNYIEKLEFWKEIRNMINSGATGTEVLKRYEIYPRHFAGILRTYDRTLEDIGEQQINARFKQEEKTKPEINRIDSIHSFMNILNQQIKHMSEQIERLKTT
ncbi:MAG: hypothetical protein GF317_14935 [Candidatus Lokiarchaeota archaeon]|nr:hypothetical protein [Candidatus Lokiarchaeota archaeon]MBD3200887.1 hypothetical protein [Candidatus Lokiarchaeota archaeon]